MRRRKLPAEVPVPGGVITTKLSMTPISLAIDVLGAGVAVDPNAVRQDVVIEDEARQRVLYREGPYDSADVQRALRRIFLEVQRVGLDQYLRAKQVEHGRIGPVTARQGPGPLRPVWDYLLAWGGSLVRRGRAR